MQISAIKSVATNSVAVKGNVLSNSKSPLAPPHQNDSKKLTLASDCIANSNKAMINFKGRGEKFDEERLQRLLNQQDELHKDIDELKDLYARLTFRTASSKDKPKNVFYSLNGNYSSSKSTLSKLEENHKNKTYNDDVSKLMDIAKKANGKDTDLEKTKKIVEEYEEYVDFIKETGIKRLNNSSSDKVSDEEFKSLIDCLNKHIEMAKESFKEPDEEFLKYADDMAKKYLIDYEYSYELQYELHKQIDCKNDSLRYVNEGIYDEKQKQAKEQFVQTNTLQIQEKLVPDIEEFLQKIYEKEYGAERTEELIRSLCNDIKTTFDDHIGGDRKKAHYAYNFSSSDNKEERHSSSIDKTGASKLRSYPKYDSWHNAMLISGLD